jgi:hypothetical protein
MLEMQIHGKISFTKRSECKVVNVFDVLHKKNEYRIFKPVEITIRRWLM